MAESRKRAILGTATVPLNLAGGASDTATATVKGVKPGHVVVVNAAVSGLTVSGFVSDNDEVTIDATNNTGGAIDDDYEISVAVIA